MEPVSAAVGVVAVSPGTDRKRGSSPPAPPPATEAWGMETAGGMVNTDETGASGDWVEVADSITSWWDKERMINIISLLHLSNALKFL